jgi:hypothetical protein
MAKCRHEYDEAEQLIEHLASQHMRCKLCHNLIFQGRLSVSRPRAVTLMEDARALASINVQRKDQD